jgi:hypothetical protein
MFPEIVRPFSDSNFARTELYELFEIFNLFVQLAYFEIRLKSCGIQESR